MVKKRAAGVSPKRKKNHVSATEGFLSLLEKVHVAHLDEKRSISLKALAFYTILFFVPVGAAILLSSFIGRSLAVYWEIPSAVSAAVIMIFFSFLIFYFFILFIRV